MSVDTKVDIVAACGSAFVCCLTSVFDLISGKKGMNVLASRFLIGTRCVAMTCSDWLAFNLYAI